MAKLIARLLCCMATLTLLTLGAQPALASDTDCPPSACAFFGGGLVASIPSTSMSPPSHLWTGSFAESVYLLGGVYTYVFDLQLTAVSPGESIFSITTGLAGGHFDNTLNYGVVFTGGTSPNTTPPVDDM